MKKRELSSNAVLNSFKTIFTVIASLITYAYITRVFSVDDIGRLHFGQAVISYFMLIAWLGTGTLAVRTGSVISGDKKRLECFADRMFTISIISTVISFVLLMILTVLPSKIAEYRTVILIQSVTVLLSPLAVEWIYAIYEDFYYIALKSIVIRLISLALLFFCIRNESDFYLYLALDSVITGLGDIFNFFYSRKFLVIKPVRDVQWYLYGGPIMTIFLYDLTATVYVHADTVMLGFMTDNTAVALYGVSTKVYFVLKDVFNAATAVTIPRIAALWNKDKKRTRSLVSDTLSFLIVFVIPASVGVILLRKEIIQLIAGTAYYGSIYSLSFLALALIFSVLATVLSKNLLISIGKEKTVAAITLLSAVVNISLNLIFIPIFSYVGAAVTTVTAEAVVFIGSFVVVRNHIRGIFCFKDFRDAAIGCAVMAVTVLFICMLMPEDLILLRTVCSVLTGAAVYCFTLLLLRNHIIIAACRNLAARFGR